MEKEIVKLNVNPKVSANTALIRNEETEKTLALIKEGVKPALLYFGTDQNIDFDIELIYSREEMDNKLGFKTQHWLIASAFENKFIIFDPIEIEKFTDHKKEEFQKIVTHETTHIIFKTINPEFCVWVHEGIALNIANQAKINDIKDENIKYFVNNCLFKNSDYQSFISKQGYDISYKLVNFLLKNYDKRKIFDLFRVKYSFSKSAEKDICKILGKNKEGIIKEFTEALKARV